MPEKEEQAMFSNPLFLKTLLNMFIIIAERLQENLFPISGHFLPLAFTAIPWL
jgi:hypothetical protein